MPTAEGRACKDETALCSLRVSKLIFFNQNIFVDDEPKMLRLATADKKLDQTGAL